MIKLKSPEMVKYVSQKLWPHKPTPIKKHTQQETSPNITICLLSNQKGNPPIQRYANVQSSENTCRPHDPKSPSSNWKHVTQPENVYCIPLWMEVPIQGEALPPGRYPDRGREYTPHPIPKVTQIRSSGKRVFSRMKTIKNFRKWRGMVIFGLGLRKNGEEMVDFG